MRKLKNALRTTKDPEVRAKLTKLIEQETGSNNKEYKLDWSLYKDKLIILTNGNLSIETINKIDDKCVFLK